MRKISIVLLVILIITAMLGCSANNSNQQSSALDSLSLSEIMSKLVDDVSDLPNSQLTELDAENFEAFAFVAMPDGAAGVVSEGMISAIAHSVVLVRAKDSEQAKSVAEDMRANANPAKWICVEAEKTEVLQKGRLVLLVMSFEDTANAIIDNFNSLS